MGLPPDRPPRKEDLAWLEALAGRPGPDLDPADAREAELLAEVLQEVHDPKSTEGGAPMASMAPADWADSGPHFSSADFAPSRERITPPSASSENQSLPPDIRYSRVRHSPPPRIDDPAPTPGGFARLLKRLMGKGLL